MRNRIKAIIFDIGGVLVCTEDPAPRQRLAVDLGLSLEALYDIVFDSDTWTAPLDRRSMGHPPRRYL